MWNLQLNDEQASVLIKALDCYSRLLMGQINMVLESYPELSYDDRQYIHRFVRKFIWKDHPENGGPGICSPDLDEKAKIAFDVLQVVRQALAWDSKGMTPGVDRREWNGMIGVSYDDPLVTSKEPLPKINKE